MAAFADWVRGDLDDVGDTDTRALLAALRGSPEWPEPSDPLRVLAIADQNRVTGELRLRLSRLPSPPAWACAIKPALEARSLAVARANTLRADAIREVGAALAANGLRSVALKGLHLAYGVYPDPADRPFGDVDLYVPPAAFPAAEAALLALGFERGVAQSGEGAIEASYLRTLRPDVTLEIDLHWKLVGALSLVREMDLDDAGLWARSTPHLPGVHFPSPEDALVFAAVNLVRHGFRPLGNLLDLRELVRKVNPAILVTRARVTRTRAALSAGLALMSVVYGAEVPADIKRGLPLPGWQRHSFRHLLRPAALARPELAGGLAARYLVKVLAQDGHEGVARTLAGMPGVVARRWAA